MSEATAATPVVDVHTHLFPPSAVTAAYGAGSWYGSTVTRHPGGGCTVTTGGRGRVLGSARHFESPQRRIERMDALRVDAQVLSLLPPLSRYGMPAADGIAAARGVNDEIAGIVAAHPTRFLGLAALPLQDPPAAVAELHRALDELGMIGAQIGTHVAGANLDDAALFPVFEALAERRAFVFVHPLDPRGDGSMQRYYLGNLVGNPYETTVAIGSLLFGGVLERLPDLALCFAHAGGYSTFALGRFAHGHQSQEKTRAVSLEPPRDVFPRLYVDSLTHDDLALRYTLDVAAPGHVLLGSDYPASMGPVDPTGDICDSDRLSAREKSDVLGGAFARMMTGLGRSGAVARLQTTWGSAAVSR